MKLNKLIYDKLNIGILFNNFININNNDSLNIFN